jgi:hypothetical protein
MQAGMTNHTNVIGAPLVIRRIGTEDEAYNKYKGVDTGVSNEVKAHLKYIINNNTNNGLLDVNIIDEFYGTDFKSKQNKWSANINPIHDGGNVRDYSTPSALNNFSYKEISGGVWKYDYRYLNANVTSKPSYANNLVGNELNYKINDTTLNWFKDAVRNGWSGYNPYGLYGDAAISLGNWGTIYTYLIDINNVGNANRTLKYNLEMKNFVGASYTVRDFSTSASVTDDNFWWIGSYVTNGDVVTIEPFGNNREVFTLFNVTIPANTRRIVRIQILNGVGITGFDNTLVLGN